MPLKAVLSILLLSASSVVAQSQGLSWTLGPFVRPVDAPIIEPDPKAVFTDPITRKPVHWEALHTFNPAAIVRHGKGLCVVSRRGRLRDHGHRHAHVPPGPGLER